MAAWLTDNSATKKQEAAEAVLDMPGVIASYRTNAVTYGVVGDHCGHNRLIQNIPMVFYGPGVSQKDSPRELRHVDVLPTILEAMGIDYAANALDGEAVPLGG